MMLERMMTDENLQKMMYPYLPVRPLPEFCHAFHREPSGD